MPSNQHILNELSEISQTVANLHDLPVFTVPENYFANFPDKLLAIIREDAKEEINLISPLLGGMKRTTPFTVPEGYFSSFEREVTKSLSVNNDVRLIDEVAALESPVKDNVLTPMAVADVVSSDADQEGVDGRVISMSPARQVYRFAIAAAVAGIVGLSAWFYFHQEQQAPIAQVNITAELPKVSDLEISEFLLSAPDMPQSDILQVAGLDNLNIEEMLKDVKDGELMEFVKDDPLLQPKKMN